jgi:hypothetical protein
MSRFNAMQSRLAFFAILVAAFAASFYLGTRHNDFPFGYHPDEPTKTEQILSPSGYRNFLHPQLLLECTQRAVDWSGTPRNTQAVAQMGRNVSAGFTAIAISAGCVLGYLCGGLLGEILIGISLLCCSSLLVYAHYFKEDAGLAMGLCLVLLATRYAIASKSWASMAWIGLACAIAASAKYVGLVFLIPGLIAAFSIQAKNWRIRLGRAGLVLVSFVLFAAAINYRGLLHFSNFRDSFESEVEHSVTSHFGLTMHRPNLFFVHRLPQEATWPILSLAILAWVILFLTWRRRNCWDLIALVIGPGFLLALSFSVIPFQRYLLPVVVMAHVTGALGAIWILEPLNRRGKGAVVALFAGIFLFVGVPRCASALQQFGDDSRDRFRIWAIGHFPPGTRIVCDFYVGLLTQENFHALPVTKTIDDGIEVTVVRSGADLPAIPVLRLDGFSYVAVADAAYERFFFPEITAEPDSLDWLAQKVGWFDDLFAHYPMVWHSAAAMNLHAYTNPEIRVYEIDGLARMPSTRQ